MSALLGDGDGVGDCVDDCVADGLTDEPQATSANVMAAATAPIEPLSGTTVRTRIPPPSHEYDGSSLRRAPDGWKGGCRTRVAWQSVRLLPAGITGLLEAEPGRAIAARYLALAGWNKWRRVQAATSLPHSGSRAQGRGGPRPEPPDCLACISCAGFHSIAYGAQRSRVTKPRLLPRLTAPRVASRAFLVALLAAERLAATLPSIDLRAGRSSPRSCRW